MFILLLNAFWAKDAFTGTVEPFAWSLDAFRSSPSNEVYRTIAIRTVGMAVLVTVTDALLAFPIAYYMARVASPRTRAILVVAILHAALGRVPRQGLRVADDPPGQWLPGVDAEPFGITSGPASTSSPTRGSSSATSGCRT